MARLLARRTARSMLVAAVLVAVPAVATPAAAAPAQPRIYGGNQASPGEYPYHALVRIDGFQCGGSLVAARYVVTAGHCVDGTSGSAELVIGVTSISGGPQNVAPEHRFTGAIIRNPDYRGGGLLDLSGGAPVNDVAVIRLDRAAPFAQLRLPRPEDTTLWGLGVPAVGIGFGTTETGRTSEQLLEVVLPVASDADCAAVFGSDYRPAGNLCAGYRGPSGKDTCAGDSGGPLLAPDGFGGFVLAGVTSFGREPCGTSFGAYAEVGATQINGFLRNVIPQAEIDPSTDTPLAGDRVAYTAQLRNPDGRGPFGGYDAVAWDLDGDGRFAEARGAVTATTVARDGVNPVSVMATDAAGNAEVRSVHVVGRRPTRVSFARRRLTVREGRAVRLRLVKAGSGAGSVELRPSRAASRGLRTRRARTSSFSSAQTVRTIRLRTRDDRRRRPRRTFTVRLGGGTGDLRPGSPARVRVTVRDDDRRGRTP